jgi:hypothetical protein
MVVRQHGPKAVQGGRRYAYTEAYRNTLDYFTGALEELGFEVSTDPVGTLVARNRPAGVPVFGIGSHCDSNRNGGKYDGTMGVVTALEVCRLNAELGLDLPKPPPTQVVSIRLPSALLNQLKAFASARDVPYQALIKLLLAESLAKRRAA